MPPKPPPVTHRHPVASPTARWLGALAAALLALVLVRALAAPPAPSPADVPPDSFSSARALEYTRVVLGPDEAPRPTASAANRASRERILASLDELGLEPTVQGAWTCPEHIGCAWSQNILARVEGQTSDAVVLSAHYDSIEASPGAADDAAGVGAAIEIVRALQHGPAPKNSLILLISDSEEVYLNGARAFWEHPWSKEAAVIVNLEASGTTGPSLLFQTGPENRWIVGMYARHAPQPATGSMLASLYALSSNATDLDVHLDHGVDAANFAFTGGSARYHTPLDNLAHLDEGSLRHQGESALALVAALLSADLEARPEGRVVYQDLLHRTVFSWGETANSVLSVLLVLLLGGLAFALRRRGAAPFGSTAKALGLSLLAVLVAGILGYTVSFLVSLGTGGHPAPWWAAAGVWELLYLVVTAVGLSLTVLHLGGRVSAWAAFVAVWSIWGAGLLVAVAYGPSFAPILLMPLAAAVLAGGAAWARAGSAPPIAVPTLITLLVWIPVCDSVASSGYSDATLGVLPWFFALSPMLPLLVGQSSPGRRPLVVGAALLAGVLGVAVLLPVADEAHPVGMNLFTVQDLDDSEVSQTQVEVSWNFAANPVAVIPEPMKKIIARDGGVVGSGWGVLGSSLSINGLWPGPALQEPAPTLLLSEDETLFTVASNRGATIHHVCTNASVTLPDGTTSPGVWDLPPGGICRVHRFYGPEEGPLRLSLGRPAEPLVLWAGDILPGAAGPTTELSAARGPHGVPFHFGDRTLVGRWVRKPPADGSPPEAGE
ncbi:MAG: M28 family peptidase [Deltaproteobacteria bacterium]|nr:M28 family peptidase [Deltaproteobacteria bacterium]